LFILTVKLQHPKVEFMDEHPIFICDYL